MKSSISAHPPRKHDHHASKWTILEWSSYNTLLLTYCFRHFCTQSSRPQKPPLKILHLHSLFLCDPGILTDSKAFSGTTVNTEFLGWSGLFGWHFDHWIGYHWKDLQVGTTDTVGITTPRPPLRPQHCLPARRHRPAKKSSTSRLSGGFSSRPRCKVVFQECFSLGKPMLLGEFWVSSMVRVSLMSDGPDSWTQNAQQGLHFVY